MKLPFAGIFSSSLRRTASGAAKIAGAAARKTGEGVAGFAASARKKMYPPRLEQPPPPPEAPAPDPGRRYTAARPQGLTVRGWREVAGLIYWKTFSDRLMLVAAGVAFYVSLSIFPALSALIWIYGLFADPSEIVAQFQNFTFLLPQGSMDIIQQQAMAIAATGYSRMNTLIIASTLIAMWSANAGMKALIESMNIIYEEEEKRSIIAINIRSMLFTLGALAIFLATLVVLVAVPLVFAYVNLEGSFARVFVVLRWPILYVITVVFLILLNRYGPSRPPIRARWAIWGSALGAALWLAVSVAFSWYVEHLSNLAATYGSIAAIAGLMLWLWLSALVILIGFELNHELELRTQRWEEEERHRAEVERWKLLAEARSGVKSGATKRSFLQRLRGR